jgi:hypothetical protein
MKWDEHMIAVCKCPPSLVPYKDRVEEDDCVNLLTLFLRVFLPRRSTQGYHK